MLGLQGLHGGVSAQDLQEMYGFDGQGKVRLVAAALRARAACLPRRGLAADPARLAAALLQVLAEYVWLGGSATDLRSKTKVLDFRPATPDEAPVIVVDGSASGQASSDSYEVYLKPRKLFKDPFRGGDHLLILCDTFQPPKVRAACGGWGGNEWG